MEEINSIGHNKIIWTLTCLQTSSFGAFLSASIMDFGFFLRSSATFCQYFPVDIPHNYKLVIDKNTYVHNISISIYIYIFKNVGIMKPNLMFPCLTENDSINHLEHSYKRTMEQQDA